MDTGKIKVTSGTPAFDRALALACEHDEREGLRRCLTRASALYPELGIETLDIAGGLVAYAGGDSPLSEATAIGLECEVTDADLARISAFYRSRDCDAAVTLSPLSHRALFELLPAAGYVPVRFTNMLVAHIDGLHGARDARIQETHDARAWGLASAIGFADGATPEEAIVRTGMIIAAGGAIALQAEAGGEIAATAGMACTINTGIGAFFAASTLPAFRRQGWQRAMIADRVARAKECGMKVVRVEADPLGASERNFRALGFVPLYSRVTWRLAKKAHPA